MKHSGPGRRRCRRGAAARGPAGPGPRAPAARTAEGEELPLAGKIVRAGHRQARLRDKCAVGLGETHDAVEVLGIEALNPGWVQGAWVCHIHSVLRINPVAE
jgi:hypothetical protein